MQTGQPSNAKTTMEKPLTRQEQEAKEWGEKLKAYKPLMINKDVMEIAIQIGVSSRTIEIYLTGNGKKPLFAETLHGKLVERFGIIEIPASQPSS